MAAGPGTTFSFSPLTAEQLYRLHLASLDILERTGVLVQEPEALQLLLDAGAHDGGASASASPPGWSRRPSRPPRSGSCCTAATAGPSCPWRRGRVFFGTGSDTPNTIDPRTARAPPGPQAGRPRHRPPLRRPGTHRLRHEHGHPQRRAAPPTSSSTSSTPWCSPRASPSSSPPTTTATCGRSCEMARVVAGGEAALREPSRS